MNSLDELILKWQEGGMTAEEMRQLNALLARRENRQVLREEFLLSAGLRDACARPSPAPANIRPMPQQARWKPAAAWIAAAAACVALSAVIVKLMIGTGDAALLAATGAKLRAGDFVRTEEKQESEIRLDHGAPPCVCAGAAASS
jgi:hypothetical protein